MVDIHSHIIPEIDDGAQSWEMAVHMCHMAARDGITHMVATPHSNDEYSYDRKSFEGLLEELSAQSGAAVTFSLGCDFHFSYDNLVQLEEDPQRFTISNTHYLLIELSDYSIPPWVTTKLGDLLAFGICPIVTHPERNLLLQKRPEQVLEWAQMGCPVQVTANSFTGRWGAKATKTAQWLMKKEAVHIIATDCHNVESRPPIMSAAFDVLKIDYGIDIAKALAIENPGAVVEDQPLPYFPT